MSRLHRRPFRGLRRRPPAEKYDAVVVGSGVGGLVTANLLAREGMRVLLVEQHYMVGGYCSTFRRAGYTFDAATHFYPLLGNKTTLTGRLLADLGIENGWIAMDPVDTFHLPDGSRFVVPADFERYRAQLDQRFPTQRENLDRFFTEVRTSYLRGLACYFRGRGEGILGEYRYLTLRQALDRHIDDDRLKLVLTADCAHWGSPPERTSFAFDSMLRLSYFLGNYYPEGGSQCFVDELALRFEERGGDILTSSRVDEIVVEGRAARGVRIETLRGPLRGRHEVRADVVISNADLRQTLDRMLAGRSFDPRLEVGLRRLRPSFPCFLVHLGLHGLPADELEAVQGYYWRDWNPDRVGSDGLICKIFVPTLYEPRLAPDGGQIVILQKVLDMQYDGVTDWPGHKRQIETAMVEHLERVLPGARRATRVQLAASARTSWRFTLNTSGSMLGWEMSPDQLGGARPDIVGPVDDLYFVGHWTRPGGGITPVIVSAMRVAEAILGGQAKPSLDPAMRHQPISGDDPNVINARGGETMS